LPVGVGAQDPMMLSKNTKTIPIMRSHTQKNKSKTSQFFKIEATRLSTSLRVWTALYLYRLASYGRLYFSQNGQIDLFLDWNR